MCYGKIRPELSPSSLIKQPMTTEGMQMRCDSLYS